MDGASKKKTLTLLSVIILSSGLIAWALLALFQADNARLERETAGEDLYQEDISTAPEEPELGQEIPLESANPQNAEPVKQPGVAPGKKEVKHK